MSEYPNERELPDNHPCFPGYLYVVGNRVFKNVPGFHNVGAMREELVNVGCEEPGVVIKNCDIGARGMWEFME